MYHGRELRITSLFPRRRRIRGYLLRERRQPRPGALDFTPLELSVRTSLGAGRRACRETADESLCLRRSRHCGWARGASWAVPRLSYGSRARAPTPRDRRSRRAVLSGRVCGRHPVRSVRVARHARPLHHIWRHEPQAGGHSKPLSSPSRAAVLYWWRRLLLQAWCSTVSTRLRADGPALAIDPRLAGRLGAVPDRRVGASSRFRHREVAALPCFVSGWGTTLPLVNSRIGQSFTIVGGASPATFDRSDYQFVVHYFRRSISDVEAGLHKQTRAPHPVGWDALFVQRHLPGEIQSGSLSIAGLTRAPIVREIVGVARRLVAA